MSHRSGDIRAIVVASRNVVIADWLFTAPAVVVQPATGAWMAWQAGIPVTTGWLALALGLYVLTGACWLPVVWLQIRMHQLARNALRYGGPLAPHLQRYAPLGFILRWPAFLSLVATLLLLDGQP